MGRNDTNRKLLTGALVGMIAGVSVMMFDKRVRSEVVKKTRRMKQFVNGIRQDPSGFINNVKDGINQVTKSFKAVSDELQNLLSQIEDIKATSNKIIESAKDAEEEIKEVGTNLVNINGSSFGDGQERSNFH